MIVGFDTETQLIRRGRLVPRFACLSLAGRGDPPPILTEECGDPAHCYLDRDPASGLWRAVLDRTDAAGVMGWLVRQTLVGQNVPFDIAVLMRAFPDHAPALLDAVAGGRVFDTKVREQLIRIATGELSFIHHPDGRNERTGYSLADLTERYLGIDISDEKADPNAWRMRFGELELLPMNEWPADARSYAAQDSVYAILVGEAQGRAWDHREVARVKDSGLTVGGFPVIVPGGPLGGRVVSEEREVAAATALHLAACWGMRLDGPSAQRALTIWRESSAAGRAAGVRRGWVRANGTVNKKALQEAVRAALGSATPMTKPSKTFPQGQVKTDEETLSLAAEYTHDDDLKAYAESVEYTGHLNRYTDLFSGVETDGHVYPVTSKPNVLVESGRISWTDPNFTAPPRKGGYRECFKPPPGTLLCSVDYEAIEIVAIAQICLWLGLGDVLAKAINDGLDLHSVMGAGLRTADGIPTTYEELRAMYKAGDSKAAEYRQIGKHSNFGFLSGLGAEGFRRMVKKQSGVVVPDPQLVRDTFFATWPPVRAYFGWVDAVVSDGVAQQFVSRRVRGGCRTTAAYNTYFQGLVADGAKYSLWLLTYASHTGRMPVGVREAAERAWVFKADGTPYGEHGQRLPGVCPPDALELAFRAFKGSRVVLFLHDEIIAALPEDRASEAAEGMALIMRWGMARHIPDVAVRADPALMKRWYKAAQTVRDADGRVIAWGPKEDAT